MGARYGKPEKYRELNKKVREAFGEGSDLNRVQLIDRIEGLEQDNLALQLKVDRLCARGIEDMQFEIKELKKAYLSKDDRISDLKVDISALEEELSLTNIILEAKDERISYFIERLSQSPWISMQKDGVQQVFPDVDGWYEVMFDDDIIYVMEWPIKDPYGWMSARYFKPWLPPLSDTEVKT